MNREAVKAAMKLVYHLAKKEIPLTTNFKDLLKFAETELGKVKYSLEINYCHAAMCCYMYIEIYFMW